MGRSDDDHGFVGYVRRDDVDLPGGEVALWAVTRHGPPPSDPEAAEWADFRAASFNPLQATDDELAGAMLDAYEEAFMAASGLNTSVASIVRAEVRFEAGTTPRGALIIRTSHPFGLGQSAVGWDGTREEALDTAAADGARAGDDLASERHTWPTMERAADRMTRSGNSSEL